VVELLFCASFFVHPICKNLNKRKRYQIAGTGFRQESVEIGGAEAPSGGFQRTKIPDLMANSINSALLLMFKASMILYL